MRSESGLYGLYNLFLQIYTGSGATSLSWKIPYIMKKFPEAYLFTEAEVKIMRKSPVLLILQWDNIYLPIMLSVCFVSFSFRFCTFQQERSTTGSGFKVLFFLKY